MVQSATLGRTEGTSLAVLPELGVRGVSKKSVTDNIVNIDRTRSLRETTVTRHFHDVGAISALEGNPCSSSALVDECFVSIRVSLEGRQFAQRQRVSSR
jgi:hypothetical protein